MHKARRIACESLEPRRHFDAGDVDATFGGPAGVEFTANAQLMLAVLTDGRAVAYGLGHIRAYRPDGSLDTGFDGDGIMDTHPLDVHVSQLLAQPGGRMLLVGTRPQLFPAPEQVAMLRLNADGSVDRTFGYKGLVAVNTDGAVVDEAAFLTGDGAIFLRVHGDTIMRFSANGKLDRTFGAGGGLDIAPRHPTRVDDDARHFSEFTIHDVVQHADGKLQIVYDHRGERSFRGVSDYQNVRVSVLQYVARLNVDGTLDASFNAGGTIRYNEFHSVDASTEDGIPPVTDGDQVFSPDLFPDGTIAGVKGPTFVRLRPDGTPDPTFGGGDGAVELSFRSGPPIYEPQLTRLADGGALVHSRAQVTDPMFLILRIETIRITGNGAVDPTFGDGGSILFEPQAPVEFPTNGPVLGPDGSIHLMRHHDVVDDLDRFQILRFWREEGPAGLYASRNIGTAPQLSVKLRVTWRDDGSVDLASLQRSFLRVVAPDGSEYRARFLVSDVSADAPVIQTTYMLAAPGGVWDAGDNGVWAVLAPSRTVRDVDGFAAMGRRLGEFLVAL